MRILAMEPRFAGYAGKSEVLNDAMTKFAFAYAEQNERDNEQLQKAIRTHRVKVSKVA